MNKLYRLGVLQESCGSRARKTAIIVETLKAKVALYYNQKIEQRLRTAAKKL
jgi:hypothetical protein